MKNKKIWIILALIIVVVLGLSFFFRKSLLRLIGQQSTARAATQGNNTVAIRPASELNQVSAAGNITLAPNSQQAMVLQVSGVTTQVAAAKSTLVAAQAKYQDLANGPSEAQRTELAAPFHKADVALQQAQQAYNQIAYSSNVGMTVQATNLQSATIDYDTAKAAYDIATQPTQTDLQSAINGVAAAQSQLKTLIQPTAAQLTYANAKVASFQAALSDLLSGPTKPDRQAAELAVEQAKLNLTQAQTNLDRARLRSPISGAVLAVNVQMGQEASTGLNAVPLADVSALELPVNVAQVDISKIKPGQTAQITIDALPGKVFTGIISEITPAITSTNGVVNYPVTIKLDKTNLARRAGRDDSSGYPA